MDYKKSQFCKKKKKKKKRENDVPFQNGGQVTDFCFASFRFWSKFENHFPKGIFNEIWLRVGEHEYIYITEIIFFFKLFGLNNFLILRNNANLC